MLRCLLILAFAMPLFAQTEAELKTLTDAFAKERAAVDAKTTPAAVLAEADRLAARAEQARKAENFAAASRLIRDARWALPAAPSTLPEGVRVIGYNRLRHGERVNSVHYSPDGKYLVSCASDRSVRVWETATGREAIVYRGHTAANTDEDAKSGISSVPLRVPEAIFLPDGKTLASAGGKQIHIWDLKTGKTLKTLTGPERLVKSIAVSDDGKLLAAGSDDKIVRVWNLESGKEVWAGQPQASRIESVAWQPKGKFVAAVDADGFLAVYNPSAEGKAPLMKIQATEGTNAVHVVRFTPDGAKIFTAGADKTPRVTPAPGADGSVPPNLSAASQKLPAHSDDILGADVTPDGKFFVSGGRDKAVRVVDALGSVVRSFAAGSNVTALAVRPDGLQIAAASDDGTLRVWDFLAIDDHRSAAASKEPLWATALDADGTLFATAGADKTIRVYNLSGKLQQTLEGSKAAITSLAFLPEDKLLSAGGDKLLRLWDAKAGKALGEWPGHSAAVLALAASNEGKTIVSGAADKTVNGWDPVKEKILWTWTARSAVTALAILPENRIAVGTADGGLSILAITGDKATLSGFANAHVSGVAALEYDGKLKRLGSVGGDGVPKIWNVPSTGNPNTLLRLSPAIKPAAGVPVALSALAFSPNGETLAAAGADKIIRLYNTTTGKEERALRGCADWVTSLAFAPDGERLIAVSAEGTARIYDVTRVDGLARGGHGGSARAVAISKSKPHSIVSVGDDKTIRFWNLTDGAETDKILCPADKLFSIAFVGEKRLVTGGSDHRLRVYALDDKNKELSALTIGEIYGITPNPKGESAGVWSRAKDTDTYGIYSVNAGGDAILSFNEKGRKVSAASFSADLSLVASGDDKGLVILHDTKTKSPLGKEWQFGEGRIADLGFSPDSKMLIVVDGKNVLHIGNIEKRKIVATGKAPEEGINGILISPVGERIALLGGDGDVRFYDYQGKELKTFALPNAAISGTFSSDGKLFLTANADGSVYAIDVP